MKKPYTLTAVVFLAFIFGLGVFLLARTPALLGAALDGWRSTGGSPAVRLDGATDGFESAVNSALREGNAAIELYGGLIRAEGKRVSEDPLEADYSVAVMDNGAITFVNLDSDGSTDVTGFADQVAGWADRLDEAGIPLLYAAYPKKTARADSGLPEGLYDLPVLKMNATVEALTERGVDLLDLRDAFEAQGDYSGLFYRTDHHWNVRGAFLAFQTICQRLRTDYGLDPDPFYEDPANYNSRILKNWFLGSQGKRVGSLFAGADDFELMTPAFDTSFTFSVPSQGMERIGSMEESILFPEYAAEKDFYNGNPYVYYAGGDFDLVTIENHNNPDGPDILMVRDSMGCALTPFLALDCSTLTLVDTRSYTGDPSELAAQLGVDLVLVLRAP